jgi:hypothetical protein
MSAEFYLAFTDPDWPTTHHDRLVAAIVDLPTFVRRTGDELWLKGPIAGWPYDVRLFVGQQPRVLLEISAHPPEIERDLAALLRWLGGETTVAVVDEDGQPGAL